MASSTKPIRISPYQYEAILHQWMSLFPAEVSPWRRIELIDRKLADLGIEVGHVPQKPQRIES